MKYQIAAAPTKTTRIIHHQFASPPAPAPAPAPGVDAVPGAVPAGWLSAPARARLREQGSRTALQRECSAWALLGCRSVSASPDNAGTARQVQTADGRGRALTCCRGSSALPDPERPLAGRPDGAGIQRGRGRA